MDKNLSTGGPKTCKKCGFILGTRPNSKDVDGICLACLNKDRKKYVDWAQRQAWLTQFIRENKNPNSPWECVVGVSGGKDSCAIVKRLIECHRVKKPLLVHICDEFTPSKAGLYNLDNLVKTYNLDLLNFRCAPKTFVEETKKSFFEKLHPLEWIEKQLYAKPLEVAKAFHIPFVFMGENSAFEYGEVRSVRFSIRRVMRKRKLYFLVQFGLIRIRIPWSRRVRWDLRLFRILMIGQGREVRMTLHRLTAKAI